MMMVANIKIYCISRSVNRARFILLLYCQAAELRWPPCHDNLVPLWLSHVPLWAADLLLFWFPSHLRGHPSTHAQCTSYSLLSCKTNFLLQNNIQLIETDLTYTYTLLFILILCLNILSKNWKKQNCTYYFFHCLLPGPLAKVCRRTLYCCIWNTHCSSCVVPVVLCYSKKE